MFKSNQTEKKTLEKASNSEDFNKQNFSFFLFKLSFFSRRSLYHNPPYLHNSLWLELLYIQEYQLWPRKCSCLRRRRRRRWWWSDLSIFFWWNKALQLIKLLVSVSSVCFTKVCLWIMCFFLGAFLGENDEMNSPPVSVKIISQLHALFTLMYHCRGSW